VIHDGKQNNCIDFTIFAHTNDIYVNHIDKCKFYSGKYSVANIIEFAKEASIDKIFLQDKSRIKIGNCDFPLSHYYILLHGMSWYNKFGFKSHQFQYEQNNNSELPNLTLDEFTNLILQNYKKKLINNTFFNVIYEICLGEKSAEIQPNLSQIIDNSATIKELINNIVQNINDDNICLFLQCLLFVSEKYVIIYSYDLSFVVPQKISPIGGRKKQNRKSKKSKKVRKYN
jgi:hypothetical protein